MEVVKGSILGHRTIYIDAGSCSAQYILQEVEWLDQRIYRAAYVCDLAPILRLV